MSETKIDDSDNDEKIINWEEEATAIINDVKHHVAEIVISRLLPCSDNKIYLNIRTIEGKDYCIHVSSSGFRIVSQQYDTIEQDFHEKNVDIENDGGGGDEVEIFETPYALLDKISPRYVESFGNQLCKQLLHLQQMRTQFNEEDEEGLEEEDEEEQNDAMNNKVDNDRNKSKGTT